MTPGIRPRATQVVTAAAALLAFGCGRVAPLDDVATPAASSETVGSASVAPSLSPTPSPLRLHPVAKLGAGSVSLLPALGFVLVANNDLLFRATPQGLHQDLALMKGFHRDWSQLDAFGMWPSYAFAEIAVRDRGVIPPTESPALIRYAEGSGWFHTRLQGYQDRIIAIGPWSEGRSLGAAFIDPTTWSESGWDPHWRLFQAGDTLSAACPDGLCRCKRQDAWSYVRTDECSPPSPKPQCVPQPSQASRRGCIARLELFANRAAFGPLPSGHVFALGVDTTVASRPVSVERWEPGKVDSILEHLDVPNHRPADVDYRLLAVSGNEVYVHRLTKPYLAVFDGNGWKPSPLPTEREPISRMIASESGTLWAIVRGKLYTRPRGQSWHSASDAVDPSVHLDEIAVSGDDNLWAIDRTAHVLWGPPVGRGIIEIPSAELITRNRQQEEMLPATPACHTIYVAIQAPIAEQQTFPEVQAAIQAERAIHGLQLIRAMRTGGQELGATVSDHDVATKFIEVLHATSPSFKPRMWCHQPTVAKLLLSIP